MALYFLNCMFVSSKSLLEKAREKHYALPAFNTSNLEMSKALFGAAEQMKAPLLVQTTPSSIEYAGLESIFSIIKTLSKNSKIPACIHLDHGRDLGLVKRCTALGYKSVMIDASRLPFNKNAALTRKAVKIAHWRGCSVEAELGSLGRLGKASLTDASQARLFVKKTGCDSLAVAIGTSHGAYKFKGKPKIDLERLREISELVSVPLVLHGASSVDKKLVKKANRYGAKLGHTAGVPMKDLKRAIKLGAAKINIDTDLRLAFTAALREFHAKNPKDFDPRNALEFAGQSVKKVAAEKIRAFGAKNRARG
ncbi:MAG: class II fructose-bisphosphate aldolase family protein [Candidatus Diapherotrites archaeon]|uniref:Class II fructose-bisphosphate aldolase family protein n=1 Tax=Candidatus Iainarchaeum sp. TaxID=3101447 RepID=A0A938YWY5_9ARCH|nr:class II fructose-bisphosphate aldolase family protein [Candidatus Diapherotrites archaeon]